MDGSTSRFSQDIQKSMSKSKFSDQIGQVFRAKREEQVVGGAGLEKEIKTGAEFAATAAMEFLGGEPGPATERAFFGPRPNDTRSLEQVVEESKQFRQGTEAYNPQAAIVTSSASQVAAGLRGLSMITNVMDEPGGRFVESAMRGLQAGTATQADDVVSNITAAATSGVTSLGQTATMGPFAMGSFFLQGMGSGAYNYEEAYIAGMMGEDRDFSRGMQYVSGVLSGGIEVGTEHFGNVLELGIGKTSMGKVLGGTAKYGPGPQIAIALTKMSLVEGFVEEGPATLANYAKGRYITGEIDPNKKGWSDAFGDALLDSAYGAVGGAAGGGISIPYGMHQAKKERQELTRRLVESNTEYADRDFWARIAPNTVRAMSSMTQQEREAEVEAAKNAVFQARADVEVVRQQFIDGEAKRVKAQAELKKAQRKKDQAAIDLAQTAFDDASDQINNAKDKLAVMGADLLAAETRFEAAVAYTASRAPQSNKTFDDVLNDEGATASTPQTDSDATVARELGGLGYDVVFFTDQNQDRDAFYSPFTPNTVYVRSGMTNETAGYVIGLGYHELLHDIQLTDSKLWSALRSAFDEESVIRAGVEYWSDQANMEDRMAIAAARASLAGDRSTDIDAIMRRHGNTLLTREGTARELEDGISTLFRTGQAPGLLGRILARSGLRGQQAATALKVRSLLMERAKTRQRGQQSEFSGLVREAMASAEARTKLEEEYKQRRAAQGQAAAPAQTASQAAQTGQATQTTQTTQVQQPPKQAVPGAAAVPPSASAAALTASGMTPADAAAAQTPDFKAMINLATTSLRKKDKKWAKNKQLYPIAEQMERDPAALSPEDRKIGEELRAEMTAQFGKDYAVLWARRRVARNRQPSQVAETPGTTEAQDEQGIDVANLFKNIYGRRRLTPRPLSFNDLKIIVSEKGISLPGNKLEPVHGLLFRRITKTITQRASRLNTRQNNRWGDILNRFDEADSKYRSLRILADLMQSVPDSYSKAIAEKPNILTDEEWNTSQNTSTTDLASSLAMMRYINTNDVAGALEYVNKFTGILVNAYKAERAKNAASHEISKAMSDYISVYNSEKKKSADDRWGGSVYVLPSNASREAIIGEFLYYSSMASQELIELSAQRTNPLAESTNDFLDRIRGHSEHGMTADLNRGRGFDTAFTQEFAAHILRRILPDVDQAVAQALSDPKKNDLATVATEITSIYSPADMPYADYMSWMTASDQDGTEELTLSIDENLRQTIFERPHQYRIPDQSDHQGRYNEQRFPEKTSPGNNVGPIKRFHIGLAPTMAAIDAAAKKYPSPVAWSVLRDFFGKSGSSVESLIAVGVWDYIEQQNERNEPVDAKVLQTLASVPVLAYRDIQEGGYLTYHVYPGRRAISPNSGYPVDDPSHRTRLFFDPRSHFHESHFGQAAVYYSQITDWYDNPNYLAIAIVQSQLSRDLGQGKLEYQNDVVLENFNAESIKSIIEGLRNAPLHFSNILVRSKDGERAIYIRRNPADPYQAVANPQNSQEHDIIVEIMVARPNNFSTKNTTSMVPHLQEIGRASVPPDKIVRISRNNTTGEIDPSTRTERNTDQSEIDLAKLKIANLAELAMSVSQVSASDVFAPFDETDVPGITTITKGQRAAGKGWVSIVMWNLVDDAVESGKTGIILPDYTAVTKKQGFPLKASKDYYGDGGFIPNILKKWGLAKTSDIKLADTRIPDPNRRPTRRDFVLANPNMFPGVADPENYRFVGSASGVSVISRIIGSMTKPYSAMVDTLGDVPFETYHGGITLSPVLTETLWPMIRSAVPGQIAEPTPGVIDRKFTEFFDGVFTFPTTEAAEAFTDAVSAESMESINYDASQSTNTVPVTAVNRAELSYLTRLAAENGGTVTTTPVTSFASVVEEESRYPESTLPEPEGSYKAMNAEGIPQAIEFSSKENATKYGEEQVRKVAVARVESGEDNALRSLRNVEIVIPQSELQQLSRTELDVLGSRLDRTKSRMDSYFYDSYNVNTSKQPDDTTTYPGLSWEETPDGIVIRITNIPQTGQYKRADPTKDSQSANLPYDFAQKWKRLLRNSIEGSGALPEERLQLIKKLATKAFDNARVVERDVQASQSQSVGVIDSEVSVLVALDNEGRFQYNGVAPGGISEAQHLQTQAIDVVNSTSQQLPGGPISLPNYRNAPIAENEFKKYFFTVHSNGRGNTRQISILSGTDIQTTVYGIHFVRADNTVRSVFFTPQQFKFLMLSISNDIQGMSSGVVEYRHEMAKKFEEEFANWQQTAPVPTVPAHTKEALDYTHTLYEFPPGFAEEWKKKKSQGKNSAMSARRRRAVLDQTGLLSAMREMQAARTNLDQARKSGDQAWISKATKDFKSAIKRMTSTRTIASETLAFRMGRRSGIIAGMIRGRKQGRKIGRDEQAEVAKAKRIKMRAAFRTKMISFTDRLDREIERNDDLRDTMARARALYQRGKDDLAERLEKKVLKAWFAGQARGSVAGAAAMKNEMVALRKDAVEIIANLPPSMRSKYLDAVARMRTPSGIAAIARRVVRDMAQAEARETVSDLMRLRRRVSRVGLREDTRSGILVATSNALALLTSGGRRLLPLTDTADLTNRIAAANQLLEQAMNAYEAEREEYRENRDNRNQEAAIDSAALSAALSVLPSEAPARISSDAPKEAAWKRLISRVRSADWYTLSEMLEGTQNGVMGKVMSSIKAGRNAMIADRRNIDRLIENAYRNAGYRSYDDYIARAVGIYGSSSAEVVSVQIGGQDRTVTIDQMLHIAALDEDTVRLLRDEMSLTQESYAPIVFSSFPNELPIELTQQEVRKIQANLTREQTNLILEMKRIINVEIGPRAMEMYFQLNGRQPNSIAGYFPRKRLGIEVMDITNADISAAQAINTMMANAGFGEERVESKSALVIGGLGRVMDGHVDESLRLIHMAMPLRYAVNVLRSRGVRFHIDRSIGGGTHAAMLKMIFNAVGLTGKPKGGFSERISANITGALISLNQKTWVRQLGGIIRLASEMTSADHASGTAAALAMSPSRRTERARQIEEINPFFYERHRRSQAGLFANILGDPRQGNEQFVTAIKASGRSLAAMGNDLAAGKWRQAARAAQESTGAIGKMLRSVDHVLRAIDRQIMLVAVEGYRSGLKQQNPSMSDAQLDVLACALAEEAFRRTQNVSDPADDTMFAAEQKFDSGYNILLFPFSSDPLKGYNQVQRAVISRDPKRIAKTAVAVGGNIALSAAVSPLFTGTALLIASMFGGDDDDEEVTRKYLMEQELKYAMIGAAGDLATMGIGYSGLVGDAIGSSVLGNPMMADDTLEPLAIRFYGDFTKAVAMGKYGEAAAKASQMLGIPVTSPIQSMTKTVQSVRPSDAKLLDYYQALNKENRLNPSQLRRMKILQARERLRKKQESAQ